MNPFAVDQTYVVSVRELHAIFRELTDTGHGHWWISDLADDHVILAFEPNTANLVSYRFPVIAHLPFPHQDGVIVCLYPPARELVESGMHMQADRIVEDDVKDFEGFWAPIFEKLTKRYSAGPSPCSGTITTDSSPSSESRNNT